MGAIYREQNIQAVPSTLKRKNDFTLKRESVNFTLKRESVNPEPGTRKEVHDTVLCICYVLKSFLIIRHLKFLIIEYIGKAHISSCRQFKADTLESLMHT
jgi:hypothetical protein